MGPSEPVLLHLDLAIQAEHLFLSDKLLGAFEPARFDSAPSDQDLISLNLH